jgi:probable rRNA maturation factor
MNVEYLDHDTLTDIITFDYSEEGILEGEIYISIDRVKENAQELEIKFENELRRVMAHGILHMIGYGDKTKDEKTIMRQKEDFCISLYEQIL